MPDMERLTDRLMLDMAQTPDQKAYARGYIDGKNYARKEIAYAVLFIVAIVLIVVVSPTLFG